MKLARLGVLRTKSSRRAGIRALASFAGMTSIEFVKFIESEKSLPCNLLVKHLQLGEVSIERHLHDEKKTAKDKNAASFIEYTSTMSAWSTLNHQSDTVTIADFRVDYFEEIPNVPIICTAKSFHRGRKLIRIDASVCCVGQNRVIATGRALFSVNRGNQEK